MGVGGSSGKAVLDVSARSCVNAQRHPNDTVPFGPYLDLADDTCSFDRPWFSET